MWACNRSSNGRGECQYSGHMSSFVIPPNDDQLPGVYWSSRRTNSLASPACCRDPSAGRAGALDLEPFSPFPGPHSVRPDVLGRCHSTITTRLDRRHHSRTRLAAAWSAASRSHSIPSAPRAAPVRSGRIANIVQASLTLAEFEMGGFGT
jgi:hypothetical protein